MCEYFYACHCIESKFSLLQNIHRVVEYPFICYMMPRANYMDPNNYSDYIEKSGLLTDVRV